MMDSIGGLSELASSSLPPLNVAGNINPTWNRSLRDLKGASETLLHHGEGPTTQQPFMGSAILGPPPVLNAYDNKPQQPPANKKAEPFLSITQILQKRQDEILNRIWRQEEDDTRRRLQDMVEKQLNDDWNRERERWLQDIAGTRTLGGLSQVHVSSEISTKMEGPGAAAFSTSRRNHLPVTPSIIQCHLDIVKRITATTTGIDIPTEFDKVAITMGNSPQAAAYVTAWRLVSCITATRFRLGGSSVGGADVIDTTIGALLHLAKLFQTNVNTRVQSAMLANQDLVNAMAIPSYRNAMAKKVAVYVKLQLGSNAGVWPLLYYALRCGDAKAALEILDSAQELTSDDATVPLRTTLTAMSHRQSEASSIWDSPGDPFMIPAQERRILSDVYDLSMTQEPKSAYRLGLLALLSGKNPVQSSIESTVEDYLYKELWKAIHEPKPLEELAELGNSIKRYGPGYFEDQEPFGWPYALPLLVTQQYKTALLYMADAGGPMGLLQGTHLALALHKADIALEDFDNGAVGGATRMDTVLTKLLEQYASFVRTEPSVGTTGALEYLVRIPQKEGVIKEIALLIVKTRDIAGIAGTLNEQGERTRSALDKHLNAAAISAILGDAGNMLLKDGYDKGKANDAGNLFMLAGYYGSILDLLNHMLFPPDVLNEDRPYWYQQAQIFHSTYLTKRTRVLTVLEQQERLHLISVSKTLMELCLFYEKLRTNDFVAAVTILDQLGILPTTKAELPVKENMYRSLDPLIQQSFPALLKGSVRALFEQYAQLKREFRGRLSATAQRTIQDLRTRAGLLVTYAGLLPGIDSDVRNAMSQMEARML